MRIGQVNPHYGVIYGGIETYVKYTSMELIRRGHEVVVFSLSRKTELASNIGPSISVLGVPIPLGLFKGISKHKLDLIHVHVNSPIAIEMATLLSSVKGIPVVATYHADPLVEEISQVKFAKLIEWMYTLILKIECECFSKIIVSSPLYPEVSKVLRHFRKKILVAPPCLLYTSPSPRDRG